MKRAATILEKEFARDHREMTRGLSHLLQALREQDDEAALQLASQVDVQAGPHIEFEESTLYPYVAQSQSSASVSDFYGEHRQVRDAIQWLKEHPPQQPISAQNRERLEQQLQVGLDHAASCGSLLSHLVKVDEADHERLLNALNECRGRARAWTELTGRS